MKTIRHILDAKGYDVVSVQGDESVFNAVKLMAEKNVGALAVLDGARLVGIVSERDCARKVILQGLMPRSTRVAEIMTSPVVCARPGQTVHECLELISEKRIRHLPVLDGEALIGMISIGNLVKAITDEQKFVIGQLESYISG